MCPVQANPVSLPNLDALIGQPINTFRLYRGMLKAMKVRGAAYGALQSHSRTTS